MAERRMFAKTIIDSDAFIEMPMSARLLYYDLSMRADDDGFVNSPRKIMRMVGATTDDMNILIARKFVIAFENGVVVIKHWRIHNYIQSDRYKETTYKEQKALLEYDENKAYRLMDTKCIQNVSTLETQDRLEIGKDRKGKNIWVAPTLEQIQEYCKSRHNNVDAQRFLDYYEASGWKDSKGNKVKNWKQKVITWEKHDSAPVKTDDYKPMTESKMSDEFKKHMEEDGW